jgi:PTH1 family peptidyl-tRNA hydrolase
MPLTFMNVSGVAVRSLLEEHRISREELLVVCDDLDLEFGRMKIRPRGSSGGHRGLASIGESLRGEDFCRLRIGIGRPERNTDPADYVLASFTRQERESLTAVIDRAAACCSTWAAEGITKSMNIFNQRST